MNKKKIRRDYLIIIITLVLLLSLSYLIINRLGSMANAENELHSSHLIHKTQSSKLNEGYK